MDSGIVVSRKVKAMTHASGPSKQEWLDRIEQGRAAWEDLVSQVDEAAMDEPGAMGDWSFKDVAAHLNGWRELTIARLESAAGDKTAPSQPWPDGFHDENNEATDATNAWLHARARERSANDILAEARDQFARIRALVEAIPEADLDARYPWLNGYPVSAVIEGMLEHLHVDHEPDLRAWLAKRARQD
jgi:hypothetical protein